MPTKLSDDTPRVWAWACHGPAIRRHRSRQPRARRPRARRAVPRVSRGPRRRRVRRLMPTVMPSAYGHRRPANPPGTTAISPPRYSPVWSVPIIAAAACLRALCHDLASPARSDPLRALVASQAALGGARPTVCFRRAPRPCATPPGATLAPTAAPPAWDAARDHRRRLAPSAPPSPPSPSGTVVVGSPSRWAFGGAWYGPGTRRGPHVMIGRRGNSQAIPRSAAPAAPLPLWVALAASVGPRTIRPLRPLPIPAAACPNLAPRRSRVAPRASACR